MYTVTQKLNKLTTARAQKHFAAQTQLSIQYAYENAADVLLEYLRKEDARLQKDSATRMLMRKIHDETWTVLLDEEMYTTHIKQYALRLLNNLQSAYVLFARTHTQCVLHTHTARAIYNAHNALCAVYALHTASNTQQAYTSTAQALASKQAITWSGQTSNL